MASLRVPFSESILLIHELTSCFSATKQGATNEFTPLTGARQLGIFDVISSCGCNFTVKRLDPI